MMTDEDTSLDDTQWKINQVIAKRRAVGDNSAAILTYIEGLRLLWPYGPMACFLSQLIKAEGGNKEQPERRFYRLC